MSYTLYVPNVECGETITYTQHQFASLQQLADWVATAQRCINPISLQINEMIAPPTNSKNQQIHSSVEYPKRTGGLEVLEAMAEKNTTPQNLRDIGAVAKIIKLEHAEEVGIELDKEATRVINELWGKLFTRSTEPAPNEIYFSQSPYLYDRRAIYKSKNVTAPEDQVFFFQFVCKYLGSFARLFHVHTDIKSLNVCKEHLDANKLTCYRYDNIAHHEIAKQFFQMLTFFRNRKRHPFFRFQNDVLYKNMNLFKTNTSAEISAEEITSQLFFDWITYQDVTDELRELMIKLTLVRYYKPTKNHGPAPEPQSATDFFKQYMETVYSLELPTPFVMYATKGTTKQHCIDVVTKAITNVRYEVKPANDVSSNLADTALNDMSNNKTEVAIKGNDVRNSEQENTGDAEYFFEITKMNEQQLRKPVWDFCNQLQPIGDTQGLALIAQELKPCANEDE